MRIIDSDTPSPLIAMCYGPAGTGKSYAIGTWPGRSLVIQTEPGRISAFEVPGAKERIKVVKIDGWDEITDIRNGLGGWLKRWKFEDDFDLLAVDSLTMLAELCKTQVCKEYPPKGNRDGIPELQQWLMIIERMRQVLSAVINCGKAVWVIGQAVVKEMGPESNPISLWLPRLPGELRTSLSYWFDLFFWTRLNGGKFEAVTEETAATLGKHRGKIPRILPLDLAHINAVWAQSFK